MSDKMIFKISPVNEETANKIKQMANDSERFRFFEDNVEFVWFVEHRREGMYRGGDIHWEDNDVIGIFVVTKNESFNSKKYFFFHDYLDTLDNSIRNTSLHRGGFSKNLDFIRHMALIEIKKHFEEAAEVSDINMIITEQNNG